MAATFLVCLKCGSAYMLDHKHQGGNDVLYAWGGQVTTERTEHEGQFRNAQGTPSMMKLPCQHEFRPVRAKVQYARLEGITDELDFDSFVCQFCNGVGTLSRSWPEGHNTCPRCEKSTLEAISFYIT